MSHTIAHVIDPDGRHRILNFDDDGMTLEYDTTTHGLAWGGEPFTTAHQRITITGRAEHTHIIADTLDDAVTSLIQSLTKRTIDAEKRADNAEKARDNARDALQRSIRILDDSAEDDEDGMCECRARSASECYCGDYS